MDLLSKIKIRESCGPHLKYQSTLLKIANAFGFTHSQSMVLLQEVYTNANTLHQNQLRKLSTQMYLSKLMINKCVFKISEHFFLHYNNQSYLQAWPETGLHNVDFSQQKIKNMPLSFRVVYLLKNIVAFEEEEIGELLNLNTFQVKERIIKANAFIKAQHFQ